MKNVSQATDVGRALHPENGTFATISVTDSAPVVLRNAMTVNKRVEYVEIEVEDADIRAVFDGGFPTTTSGKKLRRDKTYRLSRQEAERAQLLAISGTAVIQAQPYHDDE